MWSGLSWSKPVGDGLVRFGTGLSRSTPVSAGLVPFESGLSRSGPGSFSAGENRFELVSSGLSLSKGVCARLVQFEPFNTGLSRSGAV